METNVQKDLRRIVNLQVSMGCDKNCEPCSKYFDCTSKLRYDIYKNPALRKIENKMSKIKHKIAIMSGKGGVGKSTTTGMLASALRLLGAKVGVLDSDFYGPSMATIMGVFGKPMMISDEGLVPVENNEGIYVASVASTLGETDYVTWMGEQIRWALYTFLGNTVWGKLDFLLIDLPPGTGEETLNVMKAIRGLSGGIIVTIPSEVSQVVVGRGITLCKRANTRVLGLIENMGTLVCPKCDNNIDVFMSGGGRRIADKMDVKFLGTVPLDSKVSEACDEGVPYLIKFPDTHAAKIYKGIANDIIEQLGWNPS
jgi:Mrp family chromosome partitioning ATPase